MNMPDTKDYILNDPIYMKCIEKEKLQRKRQISGCLGPAQRQGLSVNGHKVTPLGDGSDRKLNCGDGCTINCINLLKCIKVFT